MMATMNEDEMPGKCYECGAPFGIHMEFGWVYYLKPQPPLEAIWMTDMEYPAPITQRIDEYGICTSYKENVT